MTEAEALKSLDVAARIFWWRPALALQRAFMLEAYARVGPGFEQPLADLGCGTSLFASALAARGLLDEVDVGLDYDLAELKETVRRPRLGVTRGDLRRLPFASGSLGSAFSNCVLSSFIGDGTAELRPALAEIGRVLRPGGRFVCCVATPAYVGNDAPYRLARSLGRDDLARRIERWIDRRNDHTVVLDQAGWASLLSDAGLRVEICRPVVGPGYADLHRWLAVIKGPDIPRRLGMTALAPVQGSAQAVLMRLAIARAFVAEVERLETLDPARAGFLLFVARKER